MMVYVSPGRAVLLGMWEIKHLGEHVELFDLTVETVGQ